jgi:DNA-binding CsgD family transcriptional regulator
VPCLSERQRQVLILLTQGVSPKEIALRIGISRRMVGFHTRHLMDKFEVQSTGQLIGRAVAMGLCNAS